MEEKILIKGKPVIRIVIAVFYVLAAVLALFFLFSEEASFWYGPFLGVTFYSAVLCVPFGGFSLTVTDKRIYGRIHFLKNVSLPLDYISSVEKITLLGGVSISTSSGKLSFLAMINASEVYETVNQLLLERQEKGQKTTSCDETAPVEKTSAIEEVKQLKELLDQGILTQEEFDKKKKELLDL